MNNKKGGSAAIIALIFLLAISSGLNMHYYKQLTIYKSKNDTLEQKLKNKENQIENGKDETETPIKQPQDISEIELVTVKNGNNNVTISNAESKIIEYFSYDATGNRVDKFKKTINNNILEYTLTKVVPNLTEKQCNTEWTWCVTVDATTGERAFGGAGSTTAWFDEYLNALEFNKVFVTQ